LKARRRPASDQVADDIYDDDYADFDDDDDNDDDGLYDEVGNSFRRRRGDDEVGVMGELLARMQQTVDLLERFVATSHRRAAPPRRRPTPKNSDDEDRRPASSSTAEKAARAVSDYFRRRPTADQQVLYTELSVAPFCVTQSNPTHQLTDCKCSFEPCWPCSSTAFTTCCI